MSLAAVLHAYVLFHGNLAFSRIPTAHYPHVVDRCYWPALELVEQLDVPLAFEFPAATLEAVAAIDGEFIAKLAELWAAGRIEVVGSGYVQSIGPLMPAQVTEHNLQYGNEVYQRLLGQRPVTALVNEQTYSAGLVDLICDAGYQALIMDWHNPFTHQRFPAEAKYRPQRVRGLGGRECDLLWSHSIAFQKLQRLAHGAMSEDDYVAYVAAQHNPRGDRVFPVYTNDLEVFDYRPGKPPMAPTGDALQPEFARIRSALGRLAADPRVSFATPSETLKRMPTALEPFELASAAQPVPCKKQQKYNVTRWAVSGRGNVYLNAQCYELHALLCQAMALADGRESAALAQLRHDLTYLWASDFRTNTTHEKSLAFSRRYGAARARALALVRQLGSPQDATVRLVNPHAFDLDGAPIEVELGNLPSGRFHDRPVIVDDAGRETRAQLEDVTHHRDGSLRSARLLLAPELEASATGDYRLQSRPVWATTPPRVRIERDAGVVVVDTPSVRLRLLEKLGGAVDSLAFPQLSWQPLVGTVGHGSFEDIRYADDFYTGHTVIITADGQRITDLRPATIDVPEDLAAYPIRIPVRVRIPTPVGEIWKTYSVYTDRPRVDLQYEFHLSPVNLTSVRLGFVTALPTAFRAGAQRYATVNGGHHVETFPLHDTAFDHGEAVSLQVTARECLGATEGWVSIGDGDLGVAIVAHRRDMCTVPMIAHRELEEGTFLHVAHSAVERDETAINLWRGHHVARFTLLGHGSSLESVRRAARLIQVPPVQTVLATAVSGQKTVNESEKAAITRCRSSSS